MKILLPLAVVGTLFLAQTANASLVLITDGTGYTGPVIDLSGYTGSYTFTQGLLSLPGGVTYQAVGTDTQGGSVLGTGGYGLLSNGISVTTPIIGTNSGIGYVELAFDQVITSFGGLFNYAPGSGGDNPFIAAYDAIGNLLGSFDLSALAPISTPGGVDEFAFRGFESDSADIASIRFGGNFIIFAAPSVAPVPVPAGLPLLLAALGGLGVVARRRKAS